MIEDEIEVWMCALDRGPCLSNIYSLGCKVQAEQVFTPPQYIYIYIYIYIYLVV
jgi:hypothetical protein